MKLCRLGAGIQPKGSVLTKTTKYGCCNKVEQQEASTMKSSHTLYYSSDVITASILVTNTDAATNRTVAHSTEMVCSGVVNRRILQGTLFVLTFSSFRGDVKWLFPPKRLKKFLNIILSCAIVIFLG